MKDSVGNEIHERAILRVFHFIGPRKRKEFMYKQVGGTKNGMTWIRHLPIKPGGDDKTNGYWANPDENGVLQNTVVVGCYCDFHIHNSLKRNPDLRD